MESHGFYESKAPALCQTNFQFIAFPRKVMRKLPSKTQHESAHLFCGCYPIYVFDANVQAAYVWCESSHFHIGCVGYACSCTHIAHACVSECIYANNRIPINWHVFVCMSSTRVSFTFVYCVWRFVVHIILRWRCCTNIHNANANEIVCANRTELNLL